MYDDAGNLGRVFSGSISADDAAFIADPLAPPLLPGSSLLTPRSSPLAPPFAPPIAPSFALESDECTMTFESVSADNAAGAADSGGISGGDSLGMTSS